MELRSQMHGDHGPAGTSDNLTQQLSTLQIPEHDQSRASSLRSTSAGSTSSRKRDRKRRKDDHASTSESDKQPAHIRASSTLQIPERDQSRASSLRSTSAGSASSGKRDRKQRKGDHASTSESDKQPARTRASKKAKTLQRVNRTRANVPNLTVEGLVSQLRADMQNRSMEKHNEKFFKGFERNMRNYAKFAPYFHIKKTYQQIADEAKAVQKSKKGYGVYEEKCTELFKNAATRSESARYVDANGKLLMCYFGLRRKHGPEVDINDSSPVRNQILGKQDGVDYYYDGLPEDMCERYHQIVQAVASKAQPTMPKSDARHKADIQAGKPATSDSGGDEDLSFRCNNAVMSYKDIDGSNTDERIGVKHFVHCWKPTGHPHDNLAPSRDTRQTAGATCGVQWYFDSSSQVSKCLAIMFSVTFPEYYKDFRKAFEAGVWFRDDPGPWIGRAVVYKLQVDVHIDGREAGPTASFPVGQFDGGYMQIPDLKTQFFYGPGDVCIFFSGVMAHKVSHWTPKAQKHGSTVTPGRISTVLFFHQNIYDILKDKPRGWGIQTGYDRFPISKDLHQPRSDHHVVE